MGYELFLCVKHEEEEQGSMRDDNGEGAEEGDTDLRVGGYGLLC